MSYSGLKANSVKSKTEESRPISQHKYASQMPKASLCSYFCMLYDLKFNDLITTRTSHMYVESNGNLPSKIP